MKTLTPLVFQMLQWLIINATKYVKINANNNEGIKMFN